MFQFRYLRRGVVVVHLRLVTVDAHDHIAGLESAVNDFGQIHVVPIGQIVLDPCRPCGVVGELKAQGDAAGGLRQLGLHIEFSVPGLRFGKVRVGRAAVGVGHLAEQRRESGVVVAGNLVVDVVLPVVLIGAVLVGTAHQCAV